jgi:hypothetical protein
VKSKYGVVPFKFLSVAVNFMEEDIKFDCYWCLAKGLQSVLLMSYTVYGSCSMVLIP